MREFRLVLPHLPESDLFPNKLRTIHWSTRARVEREARMEAYLETLCIRPKDWCTLDHAEVSYLFLVSDRRVRDMEALLIACKPYIDGMVDAGIMLSDDCWHLRIAGADVNEGVKQTIITIREVK